MSVPKRSSQQGATHAAAASRGGAVGDVAARNGVAVDRKGGAGAKGRRVVRALRRRCHDARETGSDEARRSRSGVVVLGQSAASHARARQAGPAESADRLARAADVGREAVLGATVGRGGCAGDAVSDDELEPGDHGFRAENDLIDGESLREDESLRSRERVSTLRNENVFRRNKTKHSP